MHLGFWELLRGTTSGMSEVLGLSVVLFASTNIDDIFVLLAFFADAKFRTSAIIVGQYLGIFALVAVSIAASLISLVLAPEQVGLLGLLPVLIGLKKMLGLFGADAGEEREAKTRGAALAVAGVTIANGGDNVGVYVPVFATHNAFDIGIIAAVFTVMTAIWLFCGHYLVNHQQLGVPLRRYGHRVAPFVLVGLGLRILYNSGSLHLFIAWVERAIAPAIGPRP
jgi:cadmium resistance protein CadD (predicted permease)